MESIKERISRLRDLSIKTAERPSDDIKRVVYYRLSPNNAGNDPTGRGEKGQCFTTWFFAGADVRHIASLSAHIMRLAIHDQSFTLDQLKGMVEIFIKQAGEFVDYCGFFEYGKFVNEVIECSHLVDNKEDLADLMDTLWVYGSNIGAWIYQSIPWQIGYLFPNRDQDFYQKGLDLVSKEWEPR